MKRCLICLAEEDDGRAFVQEIYCQRCLATDIGTLRYIHLKSLAKKKALENPAKDTQEPR